MHTQPPIRDLRTARSEDRSVRLGPRFSKFCWSWSGSVRDFRKKTEPLGPVPIGFSPWIPAPNEDFSKNLTKEVVKLEYLARIKTCLRAWLKNNPSNQVDYSNIFK